MPDLSSTSPISVKNGTASRDSLEIMPKSRCGKACSKAGCIRPRLMATTPYKMPVPASEKATGNPKRKNTLRRSEERRVGKECGSKCRSRGVAKYYKKKNKKTQ